MLFPVTDLHKKGQKSSQQLVKHRGSFNLEKEKWVKLLNFQFISNIKIPNQLKYQTQGLTCCMMGLHLNHHKSFQLHILSFPVQCYITRPESKKKVLDHYIKNQRRNFQKPNTKIDVNMILDSHLEWTKEQA